MTFASTMTVPPGGVWFWEDGETVIESPDYNAVVDGIRSRFAETGRSGDPVRALAEYMCPRMPREFCRGFDWHFEPSHADFAKAALSYSDMPVETSDVVMARLDRCAACPKCRHDACVTCRGVDKSVYSMFGGRRAAVPQDRRSGVCDCAGTYAMVVASVVYPKGSEAWNGTPGECWRNDE